MKLIFVTGTFPYGKGETFIENEIEYLSTAFEEIFIFASQVEKEKCGIQRVTPENVHAFPGFIKKEAKNKLFRRNLWKEIGQGCLQGNIPSKINACLAFDRAVHGSIARISEFIKSLNLQKGERVLVYSYWLYTIGTVALEISDALQNCGYKVKRVSRAHGFDLYSERNAIGYLPFQRRMVQCFDAIYPCSVKGTEYLKTKYPEYAGKIKTAYLGVVDRFNGVFPKKEKTLTIVSCSNVISVKRVNLICETLKQITDIPIRWTHFGDGELFESLKESASELPQNITVRLMGRVPNQDIYRFYNENNVNLFINVSSSEGLPVSIMEAISFGIPVIATNVGGTAEIVENKKNGGLLKEDFAVDDLVWYIRDFYNMNETEYDPYCQTSRKMNEERFVASKNYQAFCEEITHGM